MNLFTKEDVSFDYLENMHYDLCKNIYEKSKLLSYLCNKYNNTIYYSNEFLIFPR